MNDTNRGTGRTTKMLELVVAETQKIGAPDLIFVIVPNAVMIQYSMDILRRLTNATILNHRMNEIAVGPSHVRFVVDSDDLNYRLAGQRAPQFYDHAVWEQRSARLLSA